jgi:hypothetical protein
LGKEDALEEDAVLGVNEEFEGYLYGGDTELDNMKDKTDMKYKTDLAEDNNPPSVELAA